MRRAAPAKLPLLLLPLLLATLLAGGLSGCSSSNKRGELRPISATAETRTQWSASAGKDGGYVFSPALTSNGIFIAGNSGELTALDGRGQRLWRIDTGKKLSAGVGSDGRMVVVGTSKGEVLAFAASDGKALWTARVSSEVLAPPTVTDSVLVRTADNRIYALSLADGSRKWMYERGATPPLALRNHSAPLAAGPYVVAGFPGGKLVALNSQNGALIWEGPVASPKGATELERIADVVAPPVLDGRNLCAVAYQGRVACFDLAAGGNQLWTREVSSASGLTLDGQHLYVTDTQGIVHALDRNTGTSVWKQSQLAWRKLTAPVLVNGRIVVADHEGVVHFLNSMSGAFVARTKTDSSGVVAPPQALGDAVVVQTRSGDVVAIEAR